MRCRDSGIRLGKRHSQTCRHTRLAVLASCDKGRLMRFVSKYLSPDKESWNPWS
ncbi:hypothetical protein DB44_GQ00010 [Candidatus Protochlamydia amoebophila]|uniref:Uncharacterized protein n=1 Tax=Candidatus Protochlamydia amoebophila TaxID=362787 RepID=A0A0C1JJC8_9BACT|nr:hypothetical protein DB44_GQ00010 [Candidatus Protochlamydia amoebophila]